MPDFQRKPNRLSPELYTGQYWYFVTLCTQNQSIIFPLFGEDSSSGGCNGDMEVSTMKLRDIVQECLFGLRQVYPSIQIDQYVIMPNHIHIILGFEEATSLGSIMKSFKGYSQREIVKETEKSIELRQFFHHKEFNHHIFWQKSYYDRIIRNDQDYERIRQYIYDNPAQWASDSLHPDNRKDG